MHAADRTRARAHGDELHAGDAPMTLEASTLARRSLHACVADVFASERERDLEHTLRGYDDELHALDATEREKRIGDIATELFELRKAREESPSSEAEVVSAEFDVLFESHEKMAIDIAGQSLVVEKKQLSTWRFLSPLDEPEWRVCKPGLGACAPERRGTGGTSAECCDSMLQYHSETRSRVEHERVRGAGWRLWRRRRRCPSSAAGAPYATTTTTR